MKEALKTPEATQSVVRVFPYSLRPWSEIWEELIKGNKEGNFSLLEIYLGIKSEESIPSPQLIHPIGGKVEKGETSLTTAIRELNEEILLDLMPINQDVIWQGEPFNYEITSAFNYLPRRVLFFVLPVLPASDFVPVIIDSEEKKLEEFVSVNLEEFQQLIKTGEFQGRRVQGHITLAESNDVKFSPEERNKQVETIETLFQFLNRTNEEWSQELSQIFLNLVRLKNGDFFRERLPLQERNSADSPIERVKKLLSNLDEKSNETLSGIFHQAYQIFIQRKIGKLLPETKSEEVRDFADKVREAFQKGNFGLDFLYFLPQIAKAPPENFLMSKSNENIWFMGRFISHLLGDFLEEKRDFLEEILEEKRLDWQSLKKIIESPDIILSKKYFFFKELDTFLIQKLAEIFAFSEDKIREAYKRVSRIVVDFGEEVRGADKELNSMYQFHELLNEVNDASLAQTLLLFLGIDIKRNDPKFLERLRFEAGRQLVFFFKSLFSFGYYEARASAANGGPIFLLINNFFGPIVSSEIVNFGDYQKPIEYRQILNNQNIIVVDKKPPKPFHSFLRKSFQVSVEEIKDFSSYAIFLPDHYWENVEPQKGRIDAIEQILKNCIESFTKEFPEYSVTIEEDKDTFDNYRKFISGQELPSSEGKRVGSQASKIIRRKFYMTVHSPEEGKYDTVEFAFYPFESLEEELMGWREKIKDDSSYHLRRLLLPLNVNNINWSSFYELLFPPSIYPSHLPKIIKDGNIDKL